MCGRCFDADWFPESRAGVPAEWPNNESALLRVLKSTIRSHVAILWHFLRIYVVSHIHFITDVYNWSGPTLHSTTTSTLSAVITHATTGIVYS